MLNLGDVLFIANVLCTLPLQLFNVFIASLQVDLQPRGASDNIVSDVGQK